VQRKKHFSPILLHQDMTDFTLPERVDFAFVLLGSLYARDTQQLLHHFRCVANVLNDGALYFLDWCVEFAGLSEKSNAWVIEKGYCKVETEYRTQNADPVSRTFEEMITLKVQDGDKSGCEFSEKSIRRALFPQKFLMVTKDTGFEFIGWWNNWNLNEPLTAETLRAKSDMIVRPIILIRKKKR
jgi:hypothetical protein